MRSHIEKHKEMSYWSQQSAYLAAEDKPLICKDFSLPHTSSVPPTMENCKQQVRKHLIHLSLSRKRTAAQNPYKIPLQRCKKQLSLPTREQSPEKYCQVAAEDLAKDPTIKMSYEAITARRKTTRQKTKNSGANGHMTGEVSLS